MAYDKNGLLIARGSKTVFISISASGPSVTNLDLEIDKYGVLFFDPDYGEADYYDLYINNVYAGAASYDDEGIDLRYEIDYLIRNNRLVKPSDNKYTIMVNAYSIYTGKVYARGTATYTYKTKATPAQTYTFENVKQSKGRITFNAIKGAKKYYYNVYEDETDVTPYNGGYPCTTSTSIDFNNLISDQIYIGMSERSSYKVDIEAVNAKGDVIARWVGTFDFKVEPNPLSVKGKTAKVKYKKLKRKKQTLAASKVIKGVGTGRGNMTFTKVSGNRKISINSSTGKVTIKKKGLKKGRTYKVKVKIYASGNNGYEPSTVKKVTFKIKVR